MMNDFRHAVRFLLRSPAFTLSALMVLSLGIGLNVTVFSILNVLLFKPPPVHDPGALVWITGKPTGSEPAPANLSYPDLVDLGSDPATMSGVTGFAPTRLALTAGARSMAQHLGDRMDGERGLSRALGVTGGLALGLAAFGLYGVLSYAVTRRTREIGVRVALGATRRDIVRLFMGEGIRIAAGGLLVGVISGLALAMLLSGTLFGVRALDPLTTMVPAILLAVAALAASYLPVRRALRVDPMVALRRD